MAIAKNLTELIGDTPLLELCNYEKKQELLAGSSGNWNILIRSLL